MSISQIILYEGPERDTPPAGATTIYLGLDGKLYWKTSDGTVTPFYPTGAGTGDLLSDGTVPLAANWDVGAYEITMLRAHFDATTGVPFTVATSDRVVGLNADLLDGKHASDFLLSSDIDTLVKLNAVVTDATLFDWAATSLVGAGFFIDEDNMASDDATKAPSQQSVKAYVDSKTAAASIKSLYESNADTNEFSDQEQTDLANAVLKTLFDANTILAANTDDTPAAVTVAEDRIVGRISGGNITGLTATQVHALIKSLLTQPLIVSVGDETSDLTTGSAKVTFRMPAAYTLTDVRASVVTAPTGATIEVDINEGGVSVLSTVLSIDAGEKTSETAATPAVISDSALADDAEITIDIDQIGSTVAGGGTEGYTDRVLHMSGFLINPYRFATGGGGPVSSLLTDLVEWWTLNETSIYLAASHGPYDLSRAGTTSSATGKVGNALSLTTSPSGYLYSAPDATQNSGNNSWSTSVWIRPSTITNGIGTVLAYGALWNSSWYYLNWGVFVDDSKVQARIVHSITTILEFSATTLAVDTWYHIYVQYDSITKKLGISVNNGTLEESAAISGTPRSNSARFQLGDWVGPSYEYGGRIDEAATWNRILTTDERDELYNSGAGITYSDIEDTSGPSEILTGMEAWWTMAETSGTRYDAHSTLDLSAVNTPGFAVGKQGNCLDLEKDNSEYLTLGTTPSALKTAPFSFAGWINAETLTFDDILVSSGSGTAWADVEWYVRYVSGDVRFYISTGSNAYYASVTISSGTWYWLYCYYSGTDVYMSLNNEALISDNIPSDNQVTGAEFRIGGLAGSTRQWDGKVDEFGFWSRPLQVRERVRLFNGGNGITYIDL